ncbi:hypothetical protein V8E51_001183 [Hyaloscypha variabilis]
MTYLTIGYLPITLTAVIFAIPKKQNVLFPSMADHGRSWFIFNIIIISAFTYVLALYIGSVLEFLKTIIKHVWAFLIAPFGLLWAGSMERWQKLKLHEGKVKEIQVAKPTARNDIDITNLMEKGEAKLASGALTKPGHIHGLFRKKQP